jgi:hypothetical protein
MVQIDGKGFRSNGVELFLSSGQLLRREADASGAKVLQIYEYLLRESLSRSSAIGTFHLFVYGKLA